jgi:hypothetical protein
MADNDFNVGINVKTVKNASISRYSDGYNYASVSSKMGDNEYMNVHYEWKGSQVPEFAMNVMEIMKSLGKEEASKDDEYAASLERAGKFFIERAAKMKEKKKDKKKDKKGKDKDKKKDDKTDDKDSENTFPFNKKKKEKKEKK